MFLSVPRCALELGKTLTMEVNTDWKSLRIFDFMDLKTPLNWQKNKITKNQESLNETVNIIYEISYVACYWTCPL